MIDERGNGSRRRDGRPDHVERVGGIRTEAVVGTRSVAAESLHRAAKGARTTSDPRCLLDVQEAAERLGVTQRWVRRAVAERRISFVKVGRNVRFEPEAINRYIERQRRPARDDIV